MPTEGATRCRVGRVLLQSYGKLAAALDEVADGAADRRWRGLATRLRAWAVEFPHEFQLVYGTPIPGYAAPPETIPAAAAVARGFLEAGARRPVEGFGDPELTAQLTMVVEAVPGVQAAGVAAVLAELAALVGFVGLELSGHFVGLADPADRLFAALVERQVGTLGLGPS